MQAPPPQKKKLNKYIKVYLKYLLTYEQIYTTTEAETSIISKTSNVHKLYFELKTTIISSPGPRFIKFIIETDKMC